MQFKIATTKLHQILSKVSKGIGKSKVFPVTEYLQINLFEGVLSITATDTINFIHAHETGVEGEDGTIIVQADQLIKLVSKTTKEEMKFNFDGAALVAKGNGTYKLPIFEDEEFPEYTFNHSTEGKTIKTSLLKDAFNINEASISHDMVMPCLTGYNVGDTCVTTDGVKMCINNNLIFEGTEERMLITQDLANLIHALTHDEVLVQKEGNKILFTTPSIVIFGTELDGLEEYPDIAPLAELEYSNQAQLSKSDLMNVLDRLSIFVDKNDNYGIRLNFVDEGVTIEDIKKNSSEFLQYGEDTTIEDDTSLCVNLDFFKELLSVLSESNVILKFDEGLPMTIVEKSVVQILSVMEDIEVK